MIYSGALFAPKNIENRAKKGLYKKRAVCAKNGSLTDFGYNSLISYKILEMQGWLIKTQTFESTNKNKQVFLSLAEK